MTGRNNNVGESCYTARASRNSSSSFNFNSSVVGARHLLAFPVATGAA
jgi:hypothetical protein